MQDTIFSKIIRGEIPCHKVYEDDTTFAFMDINPIQPGMILVVSKNPTDQFMDLSTEDYQTLMMTVQKIARKMREVFPNKRVGIQIEGFEVPHAHVKLIPIASAGEFRAQPEADHTPDHEALAIMAKKLSLG